MPTYEVDYYNDAQAVRTKLVTTDDERLLPFLLKKQDRRFVKIKKVREVKPKEPNS